MTVEHGTGRGVEEPVGAVLARLRRARGLTGAQLAHEVGMSQPKISRIERGKGVADPEDVRQIAKALGAGEALIRDLIGRVESAQNRMTDWRPVPHGLAAMQRTVGALEDAAGNFRVFEPTIIHGLLQTSGYARAVLTAHQDLRVLEGDDTSELTVLEAVSSRIQRQEILADRGKSFAFVMTEAGLANQVCAPAEMLAQIDGLRKAATRDNISIKIVPDRAAWHLPPQHGFTILDDRLVSVDLYNTGLTSRGRLDVVRYGNVFDDFDRQATGNIEPILAKYEKRYVDLLR